MFTLFQLHLAQNVFISDSKEDLDKFYSLDSYSYDKFTKTIEENKSNFFLEKSSDKISTVDIIKDDNSETISSIPKGMKNIIFFSDSKKLTPIKSGDLCIISDKNGGKRAFYRH